MRDIAQNTAVVLDVATRLCLAGFKLWCNWATARYFQGDVSESSSSVWEATVTTCTSAWSLLKELWGVVLEVRWGRGAADIGVMLFSVAFARLLVRWYCLMCRRVCMRCYLFSSKAWAAIRRFTSSIRVTMDFESDVVDDRIKVATEDSVYRGPVKEMAIAGSVGFWRELKPCMVQVAVGQEPLGFGFFVKRKRVSFVTARHVLHEALVQNPDSVLVLRAPVAKEGKIAWLRAELQLNDVRLVEVGEEWVELELPKINDLCSALHRRAAPVGHPVKGLPCTVYVQEFRVKTHQDPETGVERDVVEVMSHSNSLAKGEEIGELRYRLTTKRGSSGSPIVQTVGTKSEYFVVGVHVGAAARGAGYNYGQAAYKGGEKETYAPLLDELDTGVPAVRSDLVRSYEELIRKLGDTSWADLVLQEEEEDEYFVDYEPNRRARAHKSIVLESQGEVLRPQKKTPGTAAGASKISKHSVSGASKGSTDPPQAASRSCPQGGSTPLESTSVREKEAGPASSEEQKSTLHSPNGGSPAELRKQSTTVSATKQSGGSSEKPKRPRRGGKRSASKPPPASTPK